MLKLVPAGDDGHAEWRWFCGHCASPSPDGLAPAPYARVCGECGLGLLLETRRSAVPEPHQPFLVVDSSLSVQALSMRGERLLGVSEDVVINCPVSELLVAADADTQRAAALPEAITQTLARDGEGHAFVRPWNTYGVRIRVRIAPCGPPRAALLILEGSPAQQLRAI